MVGIIVSGHGHFADGLISASEVIAGSQENLMAVNFPSGDTSENLYEKLEKAVMNMNCQSFLFLTDISGGTPFNQSVLLSSKCGAECRVVSGTNLPSLLEAIFSRAAMDVDALAQALIESEQAKLQMYTAVRRARSSQGAGGL